jgi:oxygen-dependent protoporphyrinogen oxidase
MTPSDALSSAAADCPRFAVVGGGISGLSAAHRLRELAPRCRLEVWEASGRLGGPLDTGSDHGFWWERGADSFTTKLPAARQLCERLGLGGAVLPTQPRQRRALVVCRGRLAPVPEGFVLMRPQQAAGILRSSVLSVRGKLRLLCEPLVPRHAGAGLPGHDESVASFATRRLGREAFERLVQPLLGGIYVADASRLSLAATMPEFLHAERDYGSLWRAPVQESPGVAAEAAAARANVASEPDGGAAQGARYHAFVTLKEGLSMLPAALEAALPAGTVRRHAAVRSIERCGAGGWLLAGVDSRTRAPLDEARYDGVVLATPAPQAAALLDKTDPQTAHLLRRIEYASSVVVNLGYEPRQFSRPLGGFGFVVPEIEGLTIVAASFPSIKFAHRSSAELTPIRVFLGGAKQPETIAWSDARLIEAARRDLEPLVGIQGDPQTAEVARWPESMPQYHVGHVQLVDAIEQRIGCLPRLRLAGNAYRGVGIPQCVESGWRAAEALAEAFRDGSGSGAAA